MRPKKANNRKLSVYLIKEEFTSFGQVVKPDLEEHPVRSAGAVIGTLYVKRGEPRRPAWVSLFQPGLEEEIYVDTWFVSAVFLTKQAGRIFAFTFGYGKTLLVPNAWEERFGLKVVLNSVDPARLRVIDRKSLDTMLTHTRTQTSRESPLQEFGLDVQQVLLKAVTGKPGDRAFGVSVSGTDALSITSEVTLATVGDKCRELLGMFSEERYRAAFPWVDNVSEITSKQRREELDAELVRRMKAGETEGLFLAVPEIIDWAGIDGFAFGRGDDPAADILLPDFLGGLRDLDRLSSDFLRSKRVRIVHSEAGISDARWSVYQCLNCEITSGGDTYILTEGKWYNVNTSFVGEVDARVADISRYAIPLHAAEREKEANYCKRLCEAEQPQFALMDGKTVVYGGGHSRIEFCDAFSADRQLIHIKRYGGSSVLSHLFTQGVNSAQAFLSDPTFRQKVLEKLPETHRCFGTEQRPSPGDYEIVFGIISKRADDLPAKLPFFSKITLMRAMNALQYLLGFRVSLAGIRIT